MRPTAFSSRSITASRFSAFYLRFLPGLAAITLVACADAAAGDGSTGLAAPVPAAASEALVQVVDVVIADDGALWVLNSAPPYLLVFDTSGASIAEFGERGGGPAEFRDPRRLIQLSTDRGSEIWVFDAVRHSLIRVDAMLDSAGDTRVQERPLDEVARRQVAEGPADRRPYVWSRGEGFGLVRQAQPMQFSLFDAALRNTEFIALAPTGGGPRPEPVASSTASPGPADFLGPVPLWASCPDGTVLMYDPDRNVVHRHTDDPAAAATLPLPEPRALPVSVEHLLHPVYEEMRMSLRSDEMPARDDVAEMLGAQLREEAAEASGILPEYVDLQCDSRNRAWIQPLSTTEGALGRGRSWLLSNEAAESADGSFTRLHFDGAFTPLHFTGDRIWGYLLDELDVPSLAYTPLP